jgi:hypothetical protein
MIAIAAMLVTLLVALSMAWPLIVVALCGAAAIAFIRYRRWKQSGVPVTFAKILSLVGLLLIAVIVPWFGSLLFILNQELSPNAEAMQKEAEIQKLLTDTQRSDRYILAIDIAARAKSYQAKERAEQAVLDSFRGLDWRKEEISPEDLRAVQALLQSKFPTAAGRRSCSVFYAQLYVLQDSPNDVYRALQAYGNQTDCGGKVEYLQKVRQRCALGGQWHAACATQLPKADLAMLKDDPALQYSIAPLLNEN